VSGWGALPTQPAGVCGLTRRQFGDWIAANAIARLGWPSRFGSWQRHSEPGPAARAEAVVASPGTNRPGCARSRQGTEFPESRFRASRVTFVRRQRPYRRSPRSRSRGYCSARAKRSSHRCRDKRCSVSSIAILTRSARRASATTAGAAFAPTGVVTGRRLSCCRNPPAQRVPPTPSFRRRASTRPSTGQHLGARDKRELEKDGWSPAFTAGLRAAAHPLLPLSRLEQPAESVSFEMRCRPCVGGSYRARGRGAIAGC